MGHSNYTGSYQPDIGEVVLIVRPGSDGQGYPATVHKLWRRRGFPTQWTYLVYTKQRAWHTWLTGRKRKVYDLAAACHIRPLPKI